MPDTDRWRFTHSDLWVLLLLTLIALWTFRGVLIGTHDPLGSSLRQWEPWQSQLTIEDANRPESFADDPTTQTWPWAHYSHENLREGDFPLWNTRMFCGTPFIANRLTGLFDPTVLIPFSLFAPPWCLTIFYLSHYLMAGWFMYLFLKCIRLSRPAATFGAVAYMLMGPFIPWGGMIAADKAYFPMILYYLERVCDRKDRAAVIGYIAAFFLISVNSYPLKVIWSLYISVAWVLFTRGYGTAPAIKRLIGLLGMLFIAILMGSMQHLPMFEFFSLSLRAHSEFGQELASATFLERYDSPLSLLAIYFPMLWGDSISGTESHLPYPVLAIYNHAYIGILAAVGFLFAPMVWRKSGHVRFFTVLAVLALLFVAWHDFYMFIARIVPGLRLSTVKPDFFALVSMIIVSAFVVDHFFVKLQADDKFAKVTKKVYCWFAGVMICTAVAAVIAHFTPTFFSPDGFRQYIYIFKSLLFVLAAGAFFYLAAARRINIKWTVAGILLLILVDLIPYHGYVNPLIPKGRTCFVTPGIQFLIDKNELEGPFRFFRDRTLVMAPNAPMIYGLDEPGGFDSFVSADYAHFFRVIDPQTEENRFTMSRNSRTLDLPSEYRHYRQPFWSFLNIRYVMSPGKMERIEREGWHFAWHEDENNLWIYENPNWLPRVFLVERIIPVSTIEDGYDLAQTIDPSTQAVVMGIEDADIPPALLEGDIIEDGDDGTVTIERYGADEIILNVDCPRDSYLVFSDTFFPGWRAWVDGDEVTVYRTDAIIKGVVVPDGTHKVRFLYDPPLYKFGWLLAVVGLILTPFIIRPVRLLFTNGHR